VAPPPEDIRHWLSRRCAILPSSVVVRRITLQQAGGFDSSLRSGCEDYDLWFRLCNLGKRFCACTVPLVYYRIHGNNTALSLDWFHEYTGVYRRQNLPHALRSVDYL
jgi:GT2 family glycosyltransferase